jgi:anaerobic selenocysteine-containing dehydrogenase
VRTSDEEGLCVEPHVAGCEFFNASGLAPALAATNTQCQASCIMCGCRVGFTVRWQPDRRWMRIHSEPTHNFISTHQHRAFISPYRARISLQRLSASEARMNRPCLRRPQRAYPASESLHSSSRVETPLPKGGTETCSDSTQRETMVGTQGNETAK